METAARASVADGAWGRGALRLVHVANIFLSHSHVCTSYMNSHSPRARASRWSAGHAQTSARPSKGGARGRVLLIGHLLLREQRVRYRALPPVYSSPVVCVGWGGGCVPVGTTSVDVMYVSPAFSCLRASHNPTPRHRW